jgi:branched-chain amino acid transport system ATP-binding protein
LLDEPAAGLNESESDELVGMLSGIRDDFGCGLLVIEHDMRVIMRLCERLQVLDYGKTIAIGTPAEVRRDPAVLVAYLGQRRGSPDA